MDVVQPAVATHTGLSDRESQGHGWLAAVHPDDRSAVMNAWHASNASRAFDVECRLRHVDGTTYRWFQAQARPLVDETGRVTEWLGTYTDIDDLRALQERQAMLLAELQHRVRNILAVIRSIAARTAESSETAEEYARHLAGRLDSLARTQVLLTRDAGAGVDLEMVVREELLSQAAQEEQIDVGGPDVSLSAKAAEILTLAVHELATNAVKYGALAEPRVVVRVHWDTKVKNDETVLSLRWTESGVRVAATVPPARGVRHRPDREPGALRAGRLRPAGVRAGRRRRAY